MNLRKNKHRGLTIKFTMTQSTSASNDKITLRGIQDFDPKQIAYSERIELSCCLRSRIPVEVMRAMNLYQVLNMVHPMSYKNRKTSESQEPEVTKNSPEQITQLIQLNEETSDQLNVPEIEDPVEVDVKQVAPYFMNLEQNHQRKKSVDRDEDIYYLTSTDSHDKTDAVTMPFNKGDKMKTLSPEDIGDSAGWWRVRNLVSGRIGFIPRNCVVVEYDKLPSKTTLNELPLELLDKILEISLLHCTVTSSARQTDDTGINSLASVDFCWFQRIRKQRFKKRVRHQLKDMHDKTRRRWIIIRNNRKFLINNMQPNDEFIDSLFSFNCITEEQTRFVQRQLSNKDKNAELVNFLRSFNETKYSSFVRCLRRTNQNAVARIVEHGGVVIKIKVRFRGATSTSSIDLQLYNKTINAFLNQTQPISSKPYAINFQHEDIQSLGAQLERQTMVLWIWCRLQDALERLHKIWESNRLAGLANIQPSISESNQRKVIIIDGNQFKKEVVMRPILVNFTSRIEVGKDEFIHGVAKLRNQMYILCRSSSPYDACSVIRVFQDRDPFLPLPVVEIAEIIDPEDFVSSEKENCLYVYGFVKKRIWKITKESNGQHKIIKWLITDDYPHTLAVSSDGQLLVVSKSSSFLRIYGSNAELIRSIKLPQDIKNPIHAVETSVGNFVILYEWNETVSGSSEIHVQQQTTKFGICVVSRDGQIVIHRFLSSNEKQLLKGSSHLSIDSDDRVFVADTERNRVILMDSDLKWNRICCPANEEKPRIQWPHRLCYDNEKKQLYVGESSYSRGVHVYTLRRI